MPAPQGVPDGALLVTQEDLAFSPAAVSLGAGKPVYFWNGETTLHNLVFDGVERSPNMEAGDVFAWRFETAGEHLVTCDYHPQMRLRVAVEP